MAEKKCCICCPFKTGITFIGLFTSFEAIFYCTLMLQDGYTPIKFTEFSFKILLLIFFVVCALTQFLLARVWLYIFWIIDMCVTILIIAILFKQVSEPGYYTDFCK